MLPLNIGGLFMDMGTGKTRCAVDLVHSRQGRLDRVIWFCPVSLKETILEEILKHTDTPPGQICVFDDDTAIRNLPAGALWYLIGTESMSASNRVALAANRVITPHSFVVVDESTYIKGHAAKRTRRITHMASRARYRAILTGTPLTQGVVDLYAQMRFLAPDILGYSSFYSFARNHLEYHPDYPGMIVNAHNTEWLAAKIAPFVYQVTKEEAGLDLPAKLFDTRYFGLTDEQAEWYDRAKWEILTSVPDWELESYTIFRLFTALQQIASGFWNRDPDGEDGELIEFPHRRLDTLADVVAALPADEKVIVWCKYRYGVHAIAARLRQEYGPDAVALYYGDLSPAERSAELARWRAEARFLVATQATGGHGLTLTEAAYAVFYENGFKYSERIQAEDRIHRIGQTRRPTYVDLVARCGIDKRIHQALAEKANVVQSFRRQVQAKKAAGREDLEKLMEAL
ncbi:MAG: DEAD/DEAH box helicase [Anaerolineae bacterium]|nr:DEAD/DEAH box helicase [Anaerolineae bacterium]